MSIDTKKFHHKGIGVQYEVGIDEDGLWIFGDKVLLARITVGGELITEIGTEKYPNIFDRLYEARDQKMQAIKDAKERWNRA